MTINPEDISRWVEHFHANFPGMTDKFYRNAAHFVCVLIVAGHLPGSVIAWSQLLTYKYCGVKTANFIAKTGIFKIVNDENTYENKYLGMSKESIIKEIRKRKVTVKNHLYAISAAKRELAKRH